MDTLVRIRVYGENSEVLKKAVSEAFTAMRRLGDLTDRFVEPGTAAFEASDVGRINAAAGVKPVKVEKDVLAMLAMAQEYHHLFKGVFDVTIGPVMDIWGFGHTMQKVPGEKELQQALDLVDSERMILDKKESTVFLKDLGMSLDLGAIAKGYATDRAVEILKDHGINEALVDAGGNIRVLGKKEGRAFWEIGVQDPRDAARLAAILSLADEAAVTSGDYNRYFMQEGERYHHLISPQTGYPVKENRSVTAIAPTAAAADALSTSLFMLSPPQALEIAEGILGVDALLVTKEGQILTTAGLQNRVKILGGVKNDE